MDQIVLEPKPEPKISKYGAGSGVKKFRCLELELEV